MEFDTYYQIKIDKEQGEMLVNALSSYARRKTRDLRHREREAEQAALDGESPTVAAICAEFPRRKKKIKKINELRDAIKILINDQKKEQ